MDRCCCTLIGMAAVHHAVDDIIYAPHTSPVWHGGSCSTLSLCQVAMMHWRKRRSYGARLRSALAQLYLLFCCDAGSLQADGKYCDRAAAPLTDLAGCELLEGASRTRTDASVHSLNSAARDRALSYNMFCLAMPCLALQTAALKQLHYGLGQCEIAIYKCKSSHVSPQLNTMIQPAGCGP